MPDRHSPAVIALGSNIAPEKHLPAAVRELGRLGRVAAVSSVWQSPPVGFLAQADFCNAAILLETAISPRELKADLRNIEERLGRVRDPQNKNGPRTIDLDLVLYGDLRADEPGLVLPDPDLHRRDFLAIPAAEVAPHVTDPATGETLSAIAETLGADKSLLQRRSDITLAPMSPEPRS